jgi:hypothetical protein
MLDYLHDGESTSRQLKALQWFKTVPHLAANHVKEIHSLVNSEEELVSNTAISVLQSIPGAIAENEATIAESLRSPDWSAQVSAVRLLASDPDVAIRHIGSFFSLLDSNSEGHPPAPGFSRVGVEMLPAEDPVIASHGARLKELLRINHCNVVLAVGGIMLALPNEFPEYEATVADMLKDASWTVRRNGISLLALDEGMVTRHLNAVAGLVGDPVEEVATTAADMIEGLPNGIAAVESSLASLLEMRPAHGSRAVSIRLLASDWSVASRHLDGFVRMLSAFDYQTSGEAATAILNTPGGVAACEPALADLLRSPESSQEDAVAHAIGLLSSEPELAKRYAQDFVRLLERRDWLVLPAAAHALAKIPGIVAENELSIRALLDSPNEDQRYHAIVLLASDEQLAGRYVELFCHMADYDPSDDVKNKAAEVLGKLVEW